MNIDSTLHPCGAVSDKVSPPVLIQHVPPIAVVEILQPEIREAAITHLSAGNFNIKPCVELVDGEIKSKDSQRVAFAELLEAVFPEQDSEEVCLIFLVERYFSLKGITDIESLYQLLEVFQESFISFIDKQNSEEFIIACFDRILMRARGKNSFMAENVLSTLLCWPRDGTEVLQAILNTFTNIRLEIRPRVEFPSMYAIAQLAHLENSHKRLQLLIDGGYLSKMDEKSSEMKFSIISPVTIRLKRMIC